MLSPLLTETPPRLGSHKPGDLFEQAKLGWQARSWDQRSIADITRLFTSSIADLLEDEFESDAMRGALSVSGVIGTWAGPRSAGTAYVMAHHKIGDVGDGKLGAWGFPEGGMGSVTRALRDAAESFGATVRTEVDVTKILVTDGTVRGVVTSTGEEIRADVVIAATHPQITFLRQLDPSELPDDFVDDLRRWKTRSGTVKVNLAIDRLPEFTAAPGFDPEVHGGTIVLAPSLDHVENAFQDAVAGRPAAAPFADICIPSVFDTTLAPEGKHVVSMFTQWVPHEWANEPHRDELDAYADRIIDQVEAAAPGLSRLDPAPPGDRPVRHGADLRPARRQHLPRRALTGAAVPHAARARVRGLPHADPQPLPGVVGDPRRRRRHRHPGAEGRRADPPRPQGSPLPPRPPPPPLTRGAAGS